MRSGVQEALEEEVVLQGVDVGDSKREGDQGTRRRASARADGNVVFPGVTDEIPGDEEIAGKAHLLDDPDLPLQALVVRLRAEFGERARAAPSELLEAPIEPVATDLREVGDQRLAFRHRKLRQMELPFGDLQRARFGDRDRVLEGLCVPSERGGTSRPPTSGRSCPRRSAAGQCLPPCAACRCTAARRAPPSPRGRGSGSRCSQPAGCQSSSRANGGRR